MLNINTLAITIICWITVFIICVLNDYVYKHPTTRLVPSPLRHTWFGGLSIVIATFIFCLPGILTGLWHASILVFMLLLVLFRKRGLQLLIDDIRMHRKDKRGLFQHSQDCYMIGGKTATFMKKMVEEHKIPNPFVNSYIKKKKKRM